MPTVERRLHERFEMNLPALVHYVLLAPAEPYLLMTRDISSRAAYFLTSQAPPEAQRPPGSVKVLLLLNVPVVDELARCMYLSIGGQITRQEEAGMVVCFADKYIFAPLITVGADNPST